MICDGLNNELFHLDGWLTVHPSITLVDFQFDAQNSYLFTYNTFIRRGQAVAQLVEALRYKPEGRGFDSRWCHWIFFHWYNRSGRTMALESTQPLTEMSTRNVSWG